MTLWRALAVVAGVIGAALACTFGLFMFLEAGDATGRVQAALWVLAGLVLVVALVREVMFGDGLMPGYWRAR